jgi:formylglycine-generating enzyme required for sulfatase activity
MISLDLARVYCLWMTQQAADETPRRRYRLPSETEWEYACRAGNAGRFCYGRDSEYLEYFARCGGEVVSLHRVAEFLPNYYGIFDMHGGLWELCNSRYPGAFADAEHRDQELWVQRGGGYYSAPKRCRSSQRNYTTTDGVHHYMGVRLVMEVLP